MSYYKAIGSIFFSFQIEQGMKDVKITRNVCLKSLILHAIQQLENASAEKIFGEKATNVLKVTCIHSYTLHVT